MITDLLGSFLILLFMVRGISRPYVALAGVIWVDLYQPQALSQSFLAGQPLSMLMTAFFALSLVVGLSKTYRPASWLYIVILPLFMGWITLTTYNAEFQRAAWPKYDTAVKIILFSYFIPYVLRSRRQLELFLWILVGSMGYFIMTAGMKSFLSGGGYGLDLVSDTGNSLWAEGSTLATQAIALLPMFFYVGRHSLLASQYRFFKAILIGLAFASLMVLVGTEARTGIIALGVLVMLALAYSQSKLKAAVVIAVLPMVVYPFVTDRWLARMNTMSNTKQESSAQGRVVVWRWTIDYVSERPLMGGGFNSYLANAGKLAAYRREGEVEISQPQGKAFHNILVEVLGEHGYVGLLMYLIIIAHTLWISHRAYKTASEDWLRRLGLCVFMSTAVYCVGGMFIGVAFYPWLYYMYGFAVAIKVTAQRTSAVESSYDQALQELTARRERLAVRAAIRPAAVGFSGGPFRGPLSHRFHGEG